jgi:hypothetical protein
VSPEKSSQSATTDEEISKKLPNMESRQPAANPVISITPMQELSDASSHPCPTPNVSSSKEFSFKKGQSYFFGKMGTVKRSLSKKDWIVPLHHLPGVVNFPGVVVEVLPVTTSDHKPLWLHFKPSFQLAPRLFRFEACWNVDEDCGAVIEQAWERDMTGCNSVEAAQLKLECCKNELLALRRQKYGAGR